MQREKQNRIRNIVIFLLPFILFLSFLLISEKVYTPENSNEMLIITNVSGCEIFNDIEKRDRCYSTIASMLQEGDVCNRIEDAEMKDTCFLNIELSVQNISLCDKIKNFDKKQWCFALALRSEKLCMEVPSSSYKEQCLADLRGLNSKSADEDIPK